MWWHILAPDMCHGCVHMKFKWAADYFFVLILHANADHQISAHQRSKSGKIVFSILCLMHKWAERAGRIVQEKLFTKSCDASFFWEAFAEPCDQRAFPTFASKGAKYNLSRFAAFHRTPALGLAGTTSHCMCVPRILPPCRPSHPNAKDGGCVAWRKNCKAARQRCC